MSTPAIIVLAWHAIILLVAANMHGKKCEYTVNFWGKTLTACVVLAVLYWGGFFA
jgi:hypothetical protein